MRVFWLLDLDCRLKITWRSMRLQRIAMASNPLLIPKVLGRKIDLNRQTKSNDRRTQKNHERQENCRFWLLKRCEGVVGVLTRPKSGWIERSRRDLARRVSPSDSHQRGGKAAELWALCTRQNRKRRVLDSMLPPGIDSMNPVRENRARAEQSRARRRIADNRISIFLGRIVCNQASLHHTTQN